MSRRAKIVCTLGPATSTHEAVRALVDSGMNVARLNFSHGSREEHAALYKAVRAASDASQRAVGILVDLQGPKIRLGTFGDRLVTLVPGAEFTLTVDDVPGTAKRASVSYPDFARDVKSGDTVLIDDGNVRLEVLASDGRSARTRVVEGGVISDHKGINLPGAMVSAPAMSEKDLDDLRFALALGVDMIALSFVRKATDVDAVRHEMQAAGRMLPVIAKLEKPEAVEHLPAIVDAFDALMVARGDLGVELPLEQVPLVQKRAVRMARERGKPVIVATQMLESMIHQSLPTRAETSDVANATLDGADALMLSAETSVGEYPLAAVATMARIIEAAEAESSLPPIAVRPASRSAAIAAAAARVAEDLGACALVAFTQSGFTATRLASHRSHIPLLAFTSEPAVRSRLALAWGVETFVVPHVHHTDEMVAQVDRAMLELGRGAPGQLVVIVAGTPPGTIGSTNMLRVHRLGD